MQPLPLKRSIATDFIEYPATALKCQFQLAKVNKVKPFVAIAAG